MKYWYSASKNGFFSSAFHHVDNLPHDAVELTPEEYSYLITQNQRGMKIVSVNGKPQAKSN